MKSLRIRYGPEGEPELNVEDMRASGDKNLERLAEADRKKCTSMFVRGDDNGWLTPTEVRAAVGIHT